MVYQLSKALIVPEYENGRIKLYVNNAANGQAIENPRFTLDVQAILNNLFPGQGRLASPNACSLWENDLYFTNSSTNSHAVLRVPDYLNQGNTLAEQRAHIVTLDGKDYVGLAFDSSGHLYVAEGNSFDNRLVQYRVNTVVGDRSGNNHMQRTDLGNAGVTAYFSNLVFDSNGNLWVSDYRNNRVVAFLNGFNASVKVFDDPGENAVFNRPEGLDFDEDGNLWVANNNDGNGQAQSPHTRIVKLHQGHMSTVILTNAVSTLVPGSNCTVFNVANNLGGVKPQFGGLQIDRDRTNNRHRIFVNEQKSTQGRFYDIVSPASIAEGALNTLSITSTNKGNGGIALLRQTLANRQPIDYDLYMADTSVATPANTDAGLEPNLITGVTHAWESMDIWCTNTPTGLVHETLAGGTAGYVRVRVRNRANTAYTMGEQVALYWAKAGTGLSWPAPWKNGDKYGAAIGSPQSLGLIPAMGERIATFPFTPPNPSDYIGDADPRAGTESGHFCLLARLVRPGAAADGMTFPEAHGTGVSDLINNALNNKRIAWRNVAFAATVPRMTGFRHGWLIPVTGFLGSNHSAGEFKTRFAIETQDARGRTVVLPKAHFLLGLSRAMLKSIHGQHLDVGDLGLSKAEPVVIDSTTTDDKSPQSFAKHRHSELLCYDILDPACFLDGLPLKAGQTFGASLFLWSSEPVIDLVVRLIQYSDQGNGPVVMGGQTIALGHTYMSDPPSFEQRSCAILDCLRQCDRSGSKSR